MKLHERLKAIMECRLDSTARMVLVVWARLLRAKRMGWLA